MSVSVVMIHLTFVFETAQARRRSKRSVCGSLHGIYFKAFIYQSILNCHSALIYIWRIS